MIPRPGEVAGVAQLAAKSGNELFECLDLARWNAVREAAGIPQQ